MDKTDSACSIGVNTENTELASSLANLALISSNLTEEQAAVLKAFALAAVAVLQQNQQNNPQDQQQQHHQQLQQNLLSSTSTDECLNLATKPKNHYHCQRQKQQEQHQKFDLHHINHHHQHQHLKHEDDYEDDGDHGELHFTQSCDDAGTESFDSTDYDDDHDLVNSFGDNNNHQHHTHDTSIELDTLKTIREFADELKQRRKFIRLSQKGAAQSLRAFTGGQQPCTDAIIYHFENLQMEPERAIQLIPMLKDWLRWAEKQRRTGKTLTLMPAVSKVPRERKRKVVLFNDKAKQYLEDSFSKNNHPDRWQLDVISEELNIPTRSIRKWFTNRRQRKRFAEKFSPMVGPTGESSEQMI